MLPERKVHALRPIHVVAGIVVGLLVSWWERASPPPENPGLYSLVTVGGCVAFLLLAGGYVLLKERDGDREHYRSNSPNTEEARRRLEQRHKQLGTLGRSMTVGGIAVVLIVLGKLLAYELG